MPPAGAAAWGEQAKEPRRAACDSLPRSPPPPRPVERTPRQPRSSAHRWHGSCGPWGQEVGLGEG
eukprot:852297-Alexandrium_andersonii.AAC.1